MAGTGIELRLVASDGVVLQPSVAGPVRDNLASLGLLVLLCRPFNKAVSHASEAVQLRYSNSFSTKNQQGFGELCLDSRRKLQHRRLVHAITWRKVPDREAFLAANQDKSEGMGLDDHLAIGEQQPRADMLLDVIYKLGEIRETVIQLDDDLLLYFLELATMQAKAKLTACLQPDIPKNREPAA